MRTEWSKEFARFFDIAYGSLLELETQLEISRRLGYLSGEVFEGLRDRLPR